jgi:hypothetical protein
LGYPKKGANCKEHIALLQELIDAKTNFFAYAGRYFAKTGLRIRF